MKSSYAKEKEFQGAVEAVGSNEFRSDYAHVWQVDPAKSRFIVGPTGKLESGEIHSKQATVSVVLRNSKRTYLVNVNLFNPYIRIDSPSTLVAGIGANWADANNGKSAETAPVDMERSFVTLGKGNALVDVQVRSVPSWVRFTSEDHGFDNGISTPDLVVQGDQLKLFATSDISMTARGTDKKVERIGQRAEFVRGAYTADLSEDLTLLRLTHTITGADASNRIESTAVYTLNSDSGSVFAGSYDDGSEFDPASVILPLACRDITDADPKPADLGVNAPAPVERRAKDTDLPQSGDVPQSGDEGQSVELPQPGSQGDVPQSASVLDGAQLADQGQSLDQVQSGEEGQSSAGESLAGHATDNQDAGTDGDAGMSGASAIDTPAPTPEATPTPDSKPESTPDPAPAP